MELLETLAVLVPLPCLHQVRYGGCFAIDMERCPMGQQGRLRYLEQPRRLAPYVQHVVTGTRYAASWCHGLSGGAGQTKDPNTCTMIAY
jgi:hypothetical protein